MAGPDVKIRSIVEQEINVVEHGQKATRVVQVPLGVIGSGTRLYFTLTMTNKGDEVATNVIVDNPIPPRTVYAIGTATSETGVVTCSIDNGVSFHSENEQQFNPSRLTDIRWVVDDLPFGSSCKLGFQVILSSAATSVWATLPRWTLSLSSSNKVESLTTVCKRTNSIQS